MPGVDLFFSAGWKFENDIANAEPYEIVTGEFDATRLYKLEYQNNYIPVLSVIVKKTMADAVGLMDEGRNIQNCEDWDYWLRLALNGARFYGMGERLFYYRRHGGNNSADTIKLRLAQAAVLVKNYRQEMLTEKETREAFVPLVNSLVIALMIAERKADAQKLIADVSGVLPGYIKRYNLLLSLTGSHSIKVFDLANRLCIKLGKIAGSK